MEKKKNKSALNVQKGISQPENVTSQNDKLNLEQISSENLFDGIRNGNRSDLGKAITLIESTQPKHKDIATQLIEKCLPHSGNSFRIGITGVPGVGKSTLIEQFGLMLIEKGHRVAVLAVDPSSIRSKGSILGDKTRMEILSRKNEAFIRPSPTAGSLGGVARKTRETIILCEAARYDYILIETVGVGQSETAVHSMVDFFLLLMLAGAGDELQGIKRGIIEMADMIAINKADGDNISNANMAKDNYQNALHLFPPKPSQWTPLVSTCSAVTKAGIADIFETVEDYQNLTKQSGYFEANRQTQAQYWLDETIWEQLKTDFFSNENMVKEYDHLKDSVNNKKISPFAAANQLLDLYKNKTR